MADTLLVLASPMGVPLYSARGLTQSLEPIEAAGVLARTVNGVLRNLAAPQMKKYKSAISCTDQRMPVLGGVFPGDQVVVDCVAELNYRTSGGSAQRPVVGGSSYVEGDFTYYRPQLTMLVTKFTETKNEYEATVAWQLDLEEEGE